MEIHGRFSSKGGSKLLQLDLAADLFDLGLQLLSVSLGDAFLQSGGSALDGSLSLSQALAGDLADDLDDLDLGSSVEAGQNDVELGLLLNSGSGSSSGDDDIDDLTERSQKLIQDGKNLFAQGEVMAQKASDLAENATDCLEEAETRLEEFTPFMTYFMSWNSIQKPLLSARMENRL